MKDLYKLLFCLLFFNANSQNDLQNANWIFGNLAWLDFNNDNVVSNSMAAYGNSVTSITPNPIYQALEGCASVSDEDGNLLFFTDGARVYRIIDNEINIIDYSTPLDNLLGNYSSVQNVIIIPRPNHQGVYYIITISGYTSSFPDFKGLAWSEFDFNTNQFISKNNIMSDGTILFDHSFLNRSEAITSCVAANGADVWLIVHMENTSYSNILSYLVTEEGINPSPSNITSIPTTLSNFSKTLKISPNTQNIVLITDQINPRLGTFNNSNGQVVLNPNPIPVENIDFAWYHGAEFSPNSEILFFTVNGDDCTLCGLLAVELSDPDLIQFVFNENNHYFNIQRALNDRIYFAPPHSNIIYEIDNPDEFGSWNINEIDLNSFSLYGLPQWIWKTCQRTLSLNSPQNDVDGFVSYRERSEWIDASNRIFSTPATQAIYHAGNYVELNPGFEAEYGTQFSAYIEGCSDDFEYRPAKSKQVKENILTAQLDQTLKGIIIYPNPSSSIIGIRSDNTFSKVTIISSEGRIVYDKATDKTNSLQVDVSGFANGVYIVNVVDENGKLVSQKLIKN